MTRTVNSDNARNGRDWSGSNRPALEAQAAEWLRSIGVLHLLLDLPQRGPRIGRRCLAAALCRTAAPWTSSARARTDGCPRGGGRRPTLLELQFPRFMTTPRPAGRVVRP